MQLDSRSVCVTLTSSADGDLLNMFRICLCPNIPPVTALGQASMSTG